MKNIAILWHEACSLHHIPGHPEQPARVDRVLAKMKANFPSEAFIEAPRATKEQILLFHKNAFLDNLLLRTKTSIDKSIDVLEHLERIDGDTIIMSKTQEAMLRAAGSVIAAVDLVLKDKYGSAFCCVRPPGFLSQVLYRSIS
jgi:acetoin utilization deacetylase AcuC-like enzyme